MRLGAAAGPRKKEAFLSKGRLKMAISTIGEKEGEKELLKIQWKIKEIDNRLARIAIKRAKNEQLYKLARLKNKEIEGDFEIERLALDKLNLELDINALGIPMIRIRQKLELLRKEGKGHSEEAERLTEELMRLTAKIADLEKRMRLIGS